MTEERVLELELAAAVPLEEDVVAEVPLVSVCAAGGAVSVALAEDSAAGDAVPVALAEASASDMDERAAAAVGSSAGAARKLTLTGVSVR